jgi:transposase
VLHNVGDSFQKARLVAEHLAAARRPAWLQQAWPRRRRAAQRQQGLRLFEEEASVAPWGALRSTGARRGQHPAVTTSGTRKGYKGFGALESFAGRLLSQGIAGRLNADSYPGFVPRSMEQTTPPLVLIPEGARAHPSAARQAFLAAHRDRITVEPLPSYSPDDNPLEYLWKKTTNRATHNQYCTALAALTVLVDKALAYLATHPDTMLGLFGLYCEESGLGLKQAA